MRVVRDMKGRIVTWEKIREEEVEVAKYVEEVKPPKTAWVRLSIYGQTTDYKSTKGEVYIDMYREVDIDETDIEQLAIQEAERVLAEKGFPVGLYMLEDFYVGWEYIDESEIEEDKVVVKKGGAVYEY